MSALKDKILILRDRLQEIESTQEKLDVVFSNFLKIKYAPVMNDSTETTRQIDKNVLSEVISSLAGIPLKNGMFLTDGFLQKDKGVLQLRLVCRHWKDVVDEIILTTLVRQLAQEIHRIPTSFGIQKIVMTFTDKASPKNQTTLQVDISAYQELHTQIGTALGRQLVGPLTSAGKITNLVEQKERNLFILWNAIKGKVFSTSETPLKTYDEISSWMHSHPEALESIGVLDLSRKGLTSLPPEIGLFAGLQRLSLENNQLQSLPEGLNLPNLQELSLDKNQLQSLPEGLNLPNLQELYLRNNQLQSLPKRFADLSKARTLQLSLNDNPLLFIDDKVLSIFYWNNRIQQFIAECNYPASSSFGRLYQNILKRSNSQEITFDMRDAFATSSNKALSKEDQNLIFYYIYLCSGSPQTTDLQWGREHLFNDSEIFARAVLKAGLDKFNRLSPDEKNKVYGIVYQKAGQPQTNDLQWGEHHAMENLVRLFDAVESL